MLSDTLPQNIINSQLKIQSQKRQETYSGKVSVGSFLAKIDTHVKEEGTGRQMNPKGPVLKALSPKGLERFGGGSLFWYPSNHRTQTRLIPAARTNEAIF